MKLKIDTSKTKIKVPILRFLYQELRETQFSTLKVPQLSTWLPSRTTPNFKSERKICKSTPKATIKNYLIYYYVVKEREQNLISLQNLFGITCNCCEKKLPNVAFPPHSCFSLSKRKVLSQKQELLPELPFCHALMGSQL